MSHSSLSPLLIYNLLLQKWETWLSTSTTHLLFVQFQFTCLVVSKLTQWSSSSPIECNPLHSCFYHWSYIAFILNSLPKLLRSADFPPTPRVKIISYIHNIVRLFWHNLHFILGSPPSCKWFFKFAYIKKRNEVSSYLSVSIPASLEGKLTYLPMKPA